MVFTDYYKTLGIELTATAESIKAAHRKMSKRFHPDVNAADEFYEDRFKEVQEAYQVLSDAKSRRLYDRVYNRFSRRGIAAGNVIHIPDDAAGKPAYSWHPDYKDYPARSLLGKRGSLLLGLITVTLTGTCAILFWGKEPKSRHVVADADVFKVAPATPPSVRQSAPQPRIVKPPKEIAAVEAPQRITLPDIDAASVSGPTEGGNRPLRIAKPVNNPAQSIQPRPNNRAAIRPLQSLAPNTLVANNPGLPAPAKQMLPPTQAKVLSNITTTRIDTDMSDLMVRRVTQVQYGYLTFLVKRSFHFRSGKRDEYTTLRYVSAVKVYKPGDLVDREALIRKGAVECSQLENKLAFMVGDYTITYAITYQALKIFATEAEAHASLQSEGRVSRL